VSAPKPIVAIVGRPNVGKSTLFNRLVGKRLAIVHDEPGVTRDRHYADAVSLGKAYTLIDTGGLDTESRDDMQLAIREQIEIALDEADVVVCALDATAPLTSADSAEVALLRRTRKPVLYLANKCDSERHEAEASELYRLGMTELHVVSALHGRGMARFEQALVAALGGPSATAGEDRTARLGSLRSRRRAAASADLGADADSEARVDPDADAKTRPDLDPLRVAVIGRPNSGKSSLVNQLLGQLRLLVHDAPGTTRDPIDTLIERHGRRFVLIDTAGLRRKSSVAKSGSVVEALSVIQGVRAMDRAHLTLLLCDGERGVDEQEAKILGLAVDRGRGVVVGLNKIDLLDARTARQAVERAREKLSFAPWTPIEKLSALTGEGTARLLRRIASVGKAYGSRVGTGELNRFFEEVLTTHPPPTRGGRAPRFYFVTQAETAPPVFVVQASDPDHVHFSYQRYVVNAIRKRFGFEGVPIQVHYRRPRRRK
jgi:GTP-binding protein